ncbi:hypothetical protein Vadar_023207 [Vaccinium darrowii]|uniref:Uncharacterized protein n=1 Tax=Vaccinium darrowii TaxID=229202 RepID=A0ACB7Y1Y5_9ERIC|nr:hypothetical protein Vadar_023207 [Vaccinium darrowii]
MPENFTPLKSRTPNPISNPPPGKPNLTGVVSSEPKLCDSSVEALSPVHSETSRSCLGLLGRSPGRNLGEHIPILSQPTSTILSPSGGGDISVRAIHILRRSSSPLHSVEPDIHSSHPSSPKQHSLSRPNPCGDPSPSTLPPSPQLEFHCLEDFPRVFRIPGQLYVAHLVTATSNLNQVTVLAESFNQPGFAAPLHIVKLNPENLIEPKPEVVHPEVVMFQRGMIQSPPNPQPLPMKILMWNCRGAASPHFRRHFNDLVRDHHPTFVIIAETRIAGSRAKDLSESLGFNHSFVVDSVGFSGGLWLLWNDDVFRYSRYSSG